MYDRYVGAVQQWPTLIEGRQIYETDKHHHSTATISTSNTDHPDPGNRAEATTISRGQTQGELAAQPRPPCAPTDHGPPPKPARRSSFAGPLCAGEINRHSQTEGRQRQPRSVSGSGRSGQRSETVINTAVEGAARIAGQGSGEDRSQVRRSKDRPEQGLVDDDVAL